MIRALTPDDLAEIQRAQGLSSNLSKENNVVAQQASTGDSISASEVTGSSASTANDRPQTSSIPPNIQSTAETATTLVDSDGDVIPSTYTTIPFDNFLMLLAFYDRQVNSGAVTLHPWQVEEGERICSYPATAQHPLKYCLCASNGSGKDSFMVAPFSVWFILTKIKSRVVITSSSGVQLTNQTETYIRNLCETINTLHGQKIFKINQRYIKCLISGSEIRMFATDEAGKAEGYHPIEPNAAFALIANEAKSIHEDIFKALSRCNGFTHYLMVSSPGEPKGSFHYAYTHWPLSKRVTSYDCTHIPLSEIENDVIQYGKHSAFFRSKHLALFTSIGGQVVITDDNITKCREYCTKPLLTTLPKRVGLDLAAGGDENVISIWQGNRQVYQYTFIERDTTVAAQIIDRELRTQGIPLTSSHIKADDGGVGRGIIDQLVRKGWTNIRRVLNQSPALNKRDFGNRGAEMWFNVSRLIQECFILLANLDDKTITQLTTRHYKQAQGSNSRVFLQSKKEAKAEGHPSPDRADAMILALEDLRVEDFLNAADRAETKPPVDKVVSLTEIINQKSEEKYSYHEALMRGDYANAEMLKWKAQTGEQLTTSNNRSCNSSLQCALE